MTKRENVILFSSVEEKSVVIIHLNTYTSNESWHLKLNLVLAFLKNIKACKQYKYKIKQEREREREEEERRDTA